MRSLLRLGVVTAFVSAMPGASVTRAKTLHEALVESEGNQNFDVD